MNEFNNKVLFVDDEQNVVKGLKVHFYKMFSVYTACSAYEALTLMANKGPFAVVVSDMCMPKMSGADFLAKVKDLYPDTVRVILTGKADLETAIDAVNRDNVFKFITKPCSRKVMQQVLESSLNQYHLVRSEHELLHKTLKATVKTFMDILSLCNPVAFSQADRVKHLVAKMAKYLNMHNSLDIELAAMLVEIGAVGVPANIIKKAYKNEKLSAAERDIVDNYKDLSYKLIADIPRLGKVAEIIQGVPVNYEDKKPSKAKESDVFWGAEIIKVALDLDILLYRGMTKKEACKVLVGKKGVYSPIVLASLADINVADFGSQKEVFRIKVLELELGMILEEDVRTLGEDSTLVLSKGQKINYANQSLLENYAKQKKIGETFLVSVFIYGS